MGVIVPRKQEAMPKSVQGPGIILYKRQLPESSVFWFLASLHPGRTSKQIIIKLASVLAVPEFRNAKL